MFISNFNLQLKLFAATVTMTVILKDLTRDAQIPVSTPLKKRTFLRKSLVACGISIQHPQFSIRYCK